MKKWIKISLILLLLIATIALLVYVNNVKKTVNCNDVKVIIKDYTDGDFISEEEITTDYINYCSNQIDIDNEFSIKKIEAKLEKNPSIANVEAYVNINGMATIEVELRKAIGRIIPLNGESYYIDQTGKMMPIVENRPARVCIVNGNIREGYTEMPYYLNQDSIATVSIIDDIYNVLTFIDKDVFWKAQIEQIYITEDKQFLVIPKVGMHEIMLGDANNIEGKFKKLEMFYKDAVNRVGWDKYKIIDLQYKGQVVGITHDDYIIPIIQDSSQTDTLNLTH